MADKQLARNENVDLNTFSDDDPLSELARIVGYDNRPALQQLQELERHRQSVRYDPIVDLEEELMREFDAYDAPEKPQPTPAPPVHADVAPVAAASPIAQPIEPAFEAPSAIADVDLGHELEMSLGQEEAPHPSAAPQPAMPQHVTAPAVPQAVATETVRKNNYPFTPNFSRATPVALNGATPRAFATPLPPAPPPAPMVAAAPPVAASVAAPQEPVPEPAMMPTAAAQAEPEIDFDLESFEIDLSDVELDLEAAEFDVAPRPAPMEMAVAVAEQDEDFSETVLPFDPSMIAETDDSVAATGDIDVPQLPVVEEANAVVDPGDYDLDIDAEMAQIFSAGRQDSVRNIAGHAASAETAGSPQAARTSHEEFADFERAMEEDFRRSLSQRQEVIGQGDRPSDRGVYADDGGYSNNDNRPRRRLMLLASAAVIVLVAGGAGAFMLMGGTGSILSGGEPQIILADKSPTKMVPLEKGGKTVPNQDKAVYDRVAGAQEAAPQQGALVSTTEEPMDVVQRTLTPDTLPLEGSNGLEAMASPADDEGADRLMPDEVQDQVASAEDDAAPAVAPRKVRTMIVKPDGTLVAREETAPEAVAAAEPNVTPVKTSVLKPAGQPVVTTAAVPAGNEEETTVDALAAAADATVQPAETAPAEAAKAQPLPEAKPVAPVKVAAKPVDTFATPSTTETKPVQTASIAPGSYVIQIASLPSEAEAQKSFNSLSGKFGSVIGGRGVDIKKAEIAGKGTYYRVRIPAGTRDEANSLCARLKSAGGSCLVTK